MNVVEGQAISFESLRGLSHDEELRLEALKCATNSRQGGLAHWDDIVAYAARLETFIREGA